MPKNRTLQEIAYQYIQQKILNGDLPANSQLSELSLAQELGISRSPVRDAITQLQAEGFVERVPRQGTLVRSLDRREIVELYEIREALESYVAAQAAERAGEEDLQQLRLFCNRMRDIAEKLRDSGEKFLGAEAMREFLATDLGFHLSLIKAMGNERILKTMIQLRVIGRLFTRVRVEHDLRLVSMAYQYHRRILSAVERSDAEAASTWMIRHVRLSKQQRLEQWDLEEGRQRDHSRIYNEFPDEMLRDLVRIEEEFESTKPGKR